MNACGREGVLPEYAARMCWLGSGRVERQVESVRDEYKP